MVADPGPGYPLVLIMPGGNVKKLPEQPWERALELNNGFDKEEFEVSVYERNTVESEYYPVIYVDKKN